MSPVSVPPVRIEPSPRPSDDLLEARRDRLCADLGTIIDAQNGSFQSLRHDQIDERAWRGKLVPDGLTSCEVDGTTRTLAVYACRSQPLSGQHTGQLDGPFKQAISDMDHCLNRPVWYPRQWFKGKIIEFGRGEKQISWRDVTVTPKPVVSLHIEEDFANRVHYMRLAISTIR